MRDEYDSRLWGDHHERFSDTVDVALKVLRSALSRLPTWDGTSQHLFALVASFAITAISFNGTTV